MLRLLFWLLGHTDSMVDANVSEEHTVYIFGAEDWMKRVCFSGTVVHTVEFRWRQNPEYQHPYRRENIKSHKTYNIPIVETSLNA
jgi:hypothetical protein